jgi:thioesterase domain-containing protein
VLVEPKLEEMRLAAIWADLLGRPSVELDDDFFQLGGNPAMLANLQQRIDIELDRRLTIDELQQSPTLHQQVTLVQKRLKDNSVLPSEVSGLESRETRNSIFWVHYLNVDLAKALRDDEVFFPVRLAAADVACLGEAPTLQEIAERLLRKIVGTQSKGPFTIGGYCLGAILAFEVACQLRAAGHEVSLVILVDAPNPPYREPHHPLRPKLIQARYIMKRASRLGLRVSLLKMRKRLLEHFPRLVEPKRAETESARIQELIETAVLEYRPVKYEGEVLLLLASKNPPHLNFLAGWQSIIPDHLHAQYVDAHHTELMYLPNVRTVAEAILSHRRSAN